MSALGELAAIGTYLGSGTALVTSPLWATGVWQWTRGRFVHDAEAPPEPEPMALFTTEPGEDQCPVCGMEDLGVRRLLNVSDGHAYTVPYGPWEAHDGCAVTRPYRGDAPPVSVPVLPPSKPRVREEEALDRLRAAAQYAMRAVHPITREKLFAEIQRLSEDVERNRARATGKLRDSISTCACIRCGKTIVAPGGIELCGPCLRDTRPMIRAAIEEVKAPAVDSKPVPSDLPTHSTPAMRRAALEDHGAGRHYQAVHVDHAPLPGCAACTMIRRYSNQLPTSGPYAWERWRRCGFGPSQKAAVAWYHAGFGPDVAQMWRKTGFALPSDLPDDLRKAWAGEE